MIRGYDSWATVNWFITASKGTFTKIGHARNIIAHRNALISLLFILLCWKVYIYSWCVCIYILYIIHIYIYGRCVFSNVYLGRKRIFVHCNYPCCDIDYETIACAWLSTIKFEWFVLIFESFVSRRVGLSRYNFEE